MRGSTIPLILAAALALWPPISGGRLSAQVLGSESQFLMEVRIEGGPRALVPARSEGSRILLGMQAVLGLAGIEVVQNEGAGPLRAVLHPRETTLLIDPEAGLVSRGGVETSFLADEGFWQEGELFLATELVELLLDVRLNASLSEQLVLIRGGENLPAVRDSERQNRARRLSLEPEGISTVGMVPATDPTLFGGATLDWSVAFGTYSSTVVQEFSTRFQGARLGVGAGLLGGSLAVFYQRNGGTSSVFGTDRTEFSWFRAWPRNRWVHQIRLGDVPGTGPLGRFFRGASISNIPFIRPTQFAMAQLIGDLPKGWDVELYRGERYLDSRSLETEGGFSFQLPTQFGFNPYRVLAYGPNGQVREFDRTFFVFQERLPAGQFEYSLGGGQCRNAACGEVANLDLRWGVWESLTLRGGAVGLWYDSIPSRQAYYGSATYQPFRSLFFSGNAVSQTLSEGSVRFYPSQELQVDLGYTHYEAGSPDPRQARPYDSEVTRSSIVYRPKALGRRTSFRASGSMARSSQNRRGEFGFWVASQISRVRIDAGVRQTTFQATKENARTLHLGDLRASWQVARGGRFSGTILRTGATLEERSGVQSAFVGVSQPFGRQWRMAFQAGWDEFHGSGFRIDLKANLTGLRLNSRNEVYEGGGQGTQTLQGSLLLGALEHPISSADGMAVGRAGITGVAFQDLNGDGIRSEGEPGIQGVRVQIPGRVERTDFNGTYSVWDLAPFKETRIQVDPTSGPNLEWTPLNEVYQLFPEPNRFNRVDLPFIRTMEVFGEIRLQPGNRAVGNINLILRPLSREGLAPGKEYRTTTFSDGGFYFMGLAPGRYRIIVLQPGLPDNAPGVDAGILEVRSQESGVMGDVVLTIGPEDLDHLRQLLQEYFEAGLFDPFLGDATEEAIRNLLRKWTTEVERARIPGGETRWIPLPRIGGR